MDKPGDIYKFLRHRQS